MSSAELRPHEFDGIQEFDNRLPNWWLWTFYIMCIFSVGYWIHYHTLGTGALPGEEYEIEQRIAAEKLEAEMAKNPVTEESLLRLAGEPAAIDDGRAAFMQNCVQCHHTDGSAKGANPGDPFRAGVDLTDEYWLHGASPMEIYQTILEGALVDGKASGMSSWKHLGRSTVTKLAAFVHKEIKGTKAEGGKPLTEEQKARATVVE